MSSRKPRKYPAESFTRDEMGALLASFPDTFVGRRNRALVVVMWRSGLRLAEALTLRPRDVDSSAKTIRVLHGKGDKARTVGTDAHSLGTINEWLEARGDRGGDVPLFCTRDGVEVKQSYVRAMLKRAARDSGVTKRVHAHAFRHTFAVELARERAPMNVIQQLLGHSSLTTTSVYLASLSPEEALDAVRDRVW